MKIQAWHEYFVQNPPLSADRAHLLQTPSEGLEGLYAEITAASQLLTSQISTFMSDGNEHHTKAPILIQRTAISTKFTSSSNMEQKASEELWRVGAHILRRLAVKHLA